MDVRKYVNCYTSKCTDVRQLLDFYPQEVLVGIYEVNGEEETEYYSLFHFLLMIYILIFFLEVLIYC
jgi:hypothetical protein